MKNIILQTLLVFITGISCRSQQSEHKTNKIFNEGVTLNLKAIDAQNRKDFELAARLNKESLEKFREVMRVDPANTAIRSVLGHCYYIDKQYDTAIMWFERSNRENGEMAANYREIGLCHLNLGSIKPAKDAIDKAFAMDTTREIRSITLADLDGIAALTRSYSEDYQKAGDKENSLNYKKYTIGILMLYLNYDKSNNDIYDRAIALAEAIGDKETVEYFRKEKNKKGSHE